MCGECSKEEPLSAENIFDCLITAFKEDDEKLKKDVLKYIADPSNPTNFQSILMSSDWLELLKSDYMLATQIMTVAFASLSSSN
jgi:hypothetical protein